MTAASPDLARAPGFRNSLVQILFVLVAAAVIVLVAFTQGFLRSSPSAMAPVPLSPAVEAKWGVRVTQVAVTADGGLIELRFIVLDSDKATGMMSSVDNLPVMHPDGSDVVVNSAAQMGEHTILTAGQTYFLLYRDTAGTVKRGTSLSIHFGDLHIDNVTAR